MLSVQAPYKRLVRSVSGISAEALYERRSLEEISVQALYKSWQDLCKRPLGRSLYKISKRALCTVKISAQAL